MGFFRQEYWSGFPFPRLGALPLLAAKTSLTETLSLTLQLVQGPSGPELQTQSSGFHPGVQSLNSQSPRSSPTQNSAPSWRQSQHHHHGRASHGSRAGSGIRSTHTRRASQVARVVKNSPANAGDVRDASSIPALGRSPGGGHGNPLQYSCLENPMDRGAWRAMAHRVTKTLKRLGTQALCARHCVSAGAKTANR